MNKIIVWTGVMFTLFTLVLITGCTVKERVPIKIGGNFALTGNLALYGTQEKNGIELALADINTKGGINGRELILISEDNQGDTKTAITATKKLLDVDNVDIFFTAFTHIVTATAPLVSEAGKIYIYQSTYAAVAQQYPYVFRDYWDAGDSGELLAQYVLSQNNTNLAYIGELSDQCEEFFKRFDAIVPLTFKQTYDPKENDFRTILLKTKKQSPQALIFCSWRSEQAIIRQLDEMGMINIPTYHLVAPFLPSSSTVNEQFKKNKAVSTWYGFAPNTQDPKIKTFVERYKLTYNEDPIPDALYAYDTILFLAQVIDSCGNTNTTCVSDQLLSSTYMGIAGNLDYDNNRTSRRDLLLITFTENGWHEL